MELSTSGVFMEKKNLKPKPKYIINDWGRINNYKSNKEVVRLQSVEGGYQLLQQNILNGFNPKYYIVSHFNDGGDNKRLQLRRLNPFYIEKDLLEVKKKLMQLLYGRGWDVMNKRCRCFFTIEYGKSTLKPHFNLLLERPPKVYDNVKSLSKLFTLSYTFGGRSNNKLKCGFNVELPYSIVKKHLHLLFISSQPRPYNSCINFFLTSSKSFSM